MLGISYFWSLIPSVMDLSGLVLSYLSVFVADIEGEMTLCWKATAFPSAETAPFMAEKVIGRKGPIWISSSRVQITFTGLPMALEIEAASTAKSADRRRPKPPPRKEI